MSTAAMPARPLPPLPPARPSGPASAPMPGAPLRPLGPPTPALAAPRRVTVVGETGRVDVALPGMSTIAELVPVLVRATTAPGDTAAHRTRFELRRIGGAPLPGDRTVAALGLRDGELLHLVAAGHGTAAAVFDDLVDAVAGNLSDAPGRWRPALSRRVAMLLAVLAFGGASLVAATMATWPAGPIAAGLVAVLLLTSGVTVSRARDNRKTIGSALAGAGLPCLLAGAFGLGGGVLSATLAGTARPMGSALAAVTGYALLAAILLPAHRAWFSIGAGAAAAGAVAAAVVATGNASPTAAAAVLVVLAVVVSPAFPILSLRLGRLPVPEVPTDMAAFREAESPTPAAEVAGRTRTAEAAFTALLTAESAIVVAGGFVLLRAGGTAGWVLTGLAGLALLVRSRAYLSVAQRAALLCAGPAMLVATAVHLVRHGGGWTPLAVVAAALLAGAGCAVHAVRAGHRPPSPYWARFLDVADFIAVTALVPAGAAVLGLYGSIQALV
jgi:type VII secretion integral membrane protein EccD